MIKLPAIVLGLMLLLSGFTEKVKAQDEDISLQTFYDELSPYGVWIQDPQYGYVWRPDVDQSDFRPYYTNGRWAMTEYGNTWVSNYDWGWAPFHYGRWVLNRYNQWLWIPDTRWGPAWVSWRTGGGYYGWAPLGPHMNVNVSFSIPSLWWVFVPQRNIYFNRFPRYYASRNYRIFNNTTIINNIYRNSYYTGPRPDDIRRATNRDVKIYNITRANRPGRSSISNNNVSIYHPRPSVRSNARVGSTVNRNENARPANVVKSDSRSTRSNRSQPQQVQPRVQPSRQEQSRTPVRTRTQTPPGAQTAPRTQALPQRKATPPRQAPPRTLPKVQSQRQSTPPPARSSEGRTSRGGGRN